MKNLSLALCFLAAFAAAARADEWTRHYAVSAKPEIRVTAGDASVTVTAGPAGSVDAKLTTIGWAIDASNVHVDERQTGNALQLDVKVPKNHFSIGNHSVRLELHVPAELLGDFHTGDGSISLHGLRGSLRADTGDGSIHGENLDGNLEAHTGDGSVYMSGRFDKLQLHTKDGSVEVEARQGSKLADDWRIETGDGSVHLRIPRDLAADLEAHTGDGAIHFDLPLMVNGSKNEHSLAGKLNGGGRPLILRTGDGSISVNGI